MAVTYPIEGRVPVTEPSTDPERTTYRKAETSGARSCCVATQSGASSDQFKVYSCGYPDTTNVYLELVGPSREGVSSKAQIQQRINRGDPFWEVSTQEGGNTTAACWHNGSVIYAEIRDQNDNLISNNAGPLNGVRMIFTASSTTT